MVWFVGSFGSFANERVDLEKEEWKFTVINDSADISSVEEACSRRDYGQIINNPDLFWLAFCKAYNQLEGEGNRDCFDVSLSGNTLSVSGREHIIEDVKRGVESIRRFFEKGSREKKSFTILPILLANDCFLRGRSESSECIDLTDWYGIETEKIDEQWFRDYIAPCLPDLSTYLSAVCSNVEVSVSYKTGESFCDYRCKAIEAFNIDWRTLDN